MVSKYNVALKLMAQINQSINQQVTTVNAEEQLIQKDVYQRIVELDSLNKRVILDLDDNVHVCPEFKYHAILDMLDIHVSLVNRKSEVIWANSKARDLFGQDMVGKMCCDVYHTPVNLADEPSPCLTRKALLDDGVQEHEIKLITHDNTEKYFEGKAQIVSRDKNGIPLAIAKIYKDITESKLAEEELKESMLKLRRNLAGTIDAMSKTVETRDPYTAGHQKRTTNIAMDIAQVMGLNQTQLNGIRMAGVIHDLGKICIPAGILSKPGKISRSEFSMIKDHPQTGYDILKDIDFNTPVADIVLQHHERLDGSGYPFGRRGDDILIEAKVIGVADVIEAMASHRPYRPALGIDIALDEIKNNRGCIYDPDVVEAAVNLFSDSGYQIAHA